MSIKAVIFDLDGTLLDTIDDIADSMNAALAEHRLSPFDTEAYKVFVGSGVDILVDRVLIGQNDTQETKQSVKKAYLDHYRLWQNRLTKPYSGITVLLETLKSLRIAVCVLSNKPDFDTKAVIKSYFADYPFFTVSGQKPGYPVKPDPQSCLEIIATLNLPKAEILYVGDTGTDMETAVNSGLDAVGVLWGFRQKEELLKGGASYIIHHPSELISIIEKRS
jgi:phosphoglycolate phosphatase